MSAVVTYSMVAVPDSDPVIMVPDVPGAAFVTKETALLFNAYFGPAQPTYLRWMSMQALGGGEFVVAAHGVREPPGMPYFAWAQANRDSVRWWRLVGTRVDAELGVVPVNVVREMTAVPASDATPGQPWDVGDMTVTRATPSIRSECGALKESSL